MPTKRWRLGWLALLAALASTTPASFAAAAETRQWTLVTDDTELRIAIVDGWPTVQRLGVPGASHNWLTQPVAAPSPDRTWRYDSGSYDPQCGTLTLLFSEGKLLARMCFQAKPGRGPIRQWSEIKNGSAEPVTVACPACPAFNSFNPGGPATIYWVNRGGNDASTQGGAFTETLANGLTKSLPMGPVGTNPIPWMAVQGEQRGLYIAWEYSGNGRLEAVAGRNGTTLEMKFVLAEQQLPIAPGATLWIPPALVGCYRGDVDEGSYSLHRFYLAKLRPPVPKGCPDPLLTYNVFFSKDLTNLGTVGKDAAFLWSHLRLAQEFGFDAFVVDAIWFPGRWGDYRGPWIWDPKLYPHGGKPFEEFCRRHGMTFGLWCSWGRCFDQAEKITHQIVADNRLGYFKHDLQGLIPGGGYQGTLGYYKVQDSLRKAFPNLILEDCCDGGTIKDLGAMSRAHYVVTTDNLGALPDRMGIYDSTFVLPPMVLQNYTWLLSGDKPGPYLWRSGMMGAWVIDVPPLPDQAESIQKAVRTYKTWIRPILRDCKVHHVLPRPDGKRWDGLFYWGPSLKKGVLFVFRPQSDQNRNLVKLKGLDPNRQYWVWSEDGAVARSLRKGEELLQKGLEVSLPTPMSSDLVFVQDGALGKPDGFVGEWDILNAAFPMEQAKAAIAKIALRIEKPHSSLLLRYGPAHASEATR